MICNQQGAWVLKPRSSEPKFVVHFVGGIFVGAAPQLAYRLFLERLSQKSAVSIHHFLTVSFFSNSLLIHATTLELDATNFTLTTN